MKDKEFSGGGREFSSPGQEFSNPGREWASRPPEADRSGQEYRQESSPVKPVKKKRRRLQPAMLTAATLVTAAVVLGPTFSSGPSQADRPRVQLPTQELSAEHRAYLDAVWENIEEADLDELETLARDPMLEDIAVNVAAPYVQRMREEYANSDGIIATANFSIDLNNIDAVQYDGEVLRVDYYRTDFLRFYYTYGGPSDFGWEYTNAGFWLSDVDTGQKHFLLSLSSHSEGSYSAYKTWESWNNPRRSADGTWLQPDGLWTEVRITEKDGPDRIEGRAVTETRMRGEYFWVVEDNRTFAWPCLYNGQVYMTYSDESGVSVSGTVYVENGYTTSWDDTVSMEENADGRPVYVPRLTHNGVPIATMDWSVRNFDTPASDDPLFAQFEGPFRLKIDSFTAIAPAPRG